MQAAAHRPVPAKDIPSHLRVCCGTMRGNYDVQRAIVILDGPEISPTEFERRAGKDSRKWKASVRIDKVSTHKEHILHCMSKQNDPHMKYHGLRFPTELQCIVIKAAFIRWKSSVHTAR